MWQLCSWQGPNLRFVATLLLAGLSFDVMANLVGRALLAEDLQQLPATVLSPRATYITAITMIVKTKTKEVMVVAVVVVSRM